MDHQTPLSNADLVRIVQAYYNAVDALDPDRLASTYSAGPFTTLQFNADEPIIGTAAIREFTARFCQVVSSIKHTMIDIWTTPIMGNVVPVDLPPGRSASTTTVVSTALPIFAIGEGPAAMRLALPAASIFTIDIASEKFVSIHNMFDIGRIYAAVKG